LDFQPEVVEYVRSRLKLPVILGTVESLGEVLEPDSFDVISAFYLLEHVPSVDAVLRACMALLRPGGWFAGAVPICDGIQARIFGSRWTHVTEAPRHLSLPTRSGLFRAAERAGYESQQLVSDSVLNCAGIVGGSLIPGSDLTSVYGSAQWI